MTTRLRLTTALLVGATLVMTACEPPTPTPPELPPPVDRCEDPSLRPVAVTAAPATVRTSGAASLEGSGGSGRYTYSLVTNVSGGSISGSRYVAGAAAGTDRVRATDDCGRSAELDIRVQPLFEVLPLRATVRPGTSFTIRVVGNTGTVEFAPASARLASGGSITAAGVYTAGATPELDLIVARDRLSGDQVLLQYRVTPSARFRARPSKMAAPTGGVVPLETAEGSGVVTWRQTGGPLKSRLDGPVRPARPVTQAHATGRQLLPNRVRAREVLALTRGRALGDLRLDVLCREAPQAHAPLARARGIRLPAHLQEPELTPERLDQPEGLGAHGAGPGHEGGVLPPLLCEVADVVAQPRELTELCQRHAGVQVVVQRVLRALG